MIYKSYAIALLWRMLLLLVALGLLAYGLVTKNVLYLSTGAILVLILFIYIYRFMSKRFVAMDDFFEAVKYRDFSRWFSEKHGTQDIRELHKGFNLINATIKSINNERQAQFVYLQKILEMVEVGIVAYNVETGEVLWTNDSFLNILDFPSFKNISFVASRQPHIYDELFETYHPNATATVIKSKQGALKVLISDTVFEIEDNSFKLVVVQNIDDTLNQNESEAWKKLLSVMTHEIMNSIAPISSLAETLQHHVQNVQRNPKEHPLSLEDLNDGISSIQKRSEGLMKFAKTYRSLHKVTTVYRTATTAAVLFKNIKDLLGPTLADKEVAIRFVLDEQAINLEIDTYLIEQALINLILNAVDATAQTSQPLILVSATRSSKGSPIISIVDNGKGIPEEVQERIFIPFFTTKPTGSGIGLSLCKQIMTLHRGKILVESEVGSGTRIDLVF